MQQYFFTSVASPVGTLKLVAGERGLAAIAWPTSKRVAVLESATEDRSHAMLIETERQLNEYFAGNRRAFDLQLDFIGTDFQKRVWAELLKIPFGETRTYGFIATRLGDPNAMRAVGAANGSNPIPIVAPCHRVIGASGALVGFGGGLETKAKLLALERGELAFDFAYQSCSTSPDPM
ncbi:MAG TPA: methylated-DNA--[protein]-cysteine S-methyltransferase [Candidatus Cybelea sp.]|jgi:methylated-DNA-[protein]-cysteine S-methyltransferase|nr:methylated-DNA--[protein]-cysteine S-methyltransferase [Candidatus Cybelea sp.]